MSIVVRYHPVGLTAEKYDATNSQLEAAGLEWPADGLDHHICFGDGVVLDMSSRADGEAVDVADVEGELGRIGHELAELDIVLVRTGRDAHYGAPGYMALGPGVTLAATRWLWERGVRVMGIDAWGWDAPLHMQAQEALERDEPGVFWAAHQADLPYSQIERLVNLDQLPPTGFKVACFPLRIVGGSGAPARVVAILDG